MKYTIIQRPSAGTLEILKRKIIDPQLRQDIDSRRVESLGICQGTVLEVMVACDAAEKYGHVKAAELMGNCPQHITCLAIWGDTGAVQASVKGVKATVDALT